MGVEANEERAQKIYDKALKIEQQFGDVLTGERTKFLWLFSLIKRFYSFILAVVNEDSLNNVYDRICEIIDGEQSCDHVWVPAKEKL
jgi:hypothetical protein